MVAGHGPSQMEVCSLVKKNLLIATLDSSTLLELITCLQTTIDELDQRSFRLKLLVKVQECNALLEKHPHLATSALENLRKRIKEQEQAEAEGSSSLTPQPKRAKKVQSDDPLKEAGSENSSADHGVAELVFPADGASAGPTTSEDGDEADGSGDAVLSRGFCALESHSLAHLRLYLSELEPSVFNTHNLKNLLTRGQRVVGKKVLCEYLEWCTGLPSTWSPTGSLRVKQVLIDYLRDMYTKRGKRAAGLARPSNWETTGLYSIVRGLDYGISLRHNFTLQEVVLKHKQLSLILDSATLSVANNFSEIQARLVEASPKGINILLSTLFPNQLVTQAGDETEEDEEQNQSSQAKSGQACASSETLSVAAAEASVAQDRSASQRASPAQPEHQQQQKEKPLQRQQLPSKVKKEPQAKKAVAPKPDSRQGSLLSHLRRSGAKVFDESKMVPSSLFLLTWPAVMGHSLAFFDETLISVEQARHLHGVVGKIEEGQG